MANKELFKSAGTQVPATDVVNFAGGTAYQLSDKEALAQLAATGMFQNTFYTKPQDQLDMTLRLAKAVPVDFLAKVAVYSRKKAYLKDMPALLLAVLATRDNTLFKQVFMDVCDNARMIRNFVQIMRSGQVGRKSLGSSPKKMVQRWFANQSHDYIFKASVGNSPSLADVIRLVHPRPKTKKREALYRYILGLDLDAKQRKNLPQLVKDFEKFKKASAGKREVPAVPFQMLASQNLSTKEWKQIAKDGGWQFTRMNLNTFNRQNVLNDQDMVDLIAERLGNKDLVRKSRQYPYQIYTSYLFSQNMPSKIQLALADAVEAAAGNIPELPGKTAILVDSSGSMRWSSSGPVSCFQQAAIFTSLIHARNKDSKVVLFDTRAQDVQLSPLDSVFTNAQRIENAGGMGGGTAMQAGFQKLLTDKYHADNIIVISDNESWSGHCGGWYGSDTLSGTPALIEFKKLKRRNNKARLALIDITPGNTSQFKNDTEALTIGGFSDAVFDCLSHFFNSSGSSSFWVDTIEKTIKLD